MKKKDTVKLPKGQIDEMQPFESWSIEEQNKYEEIHIIGQPRIEVTYDGKDIPYSIDETSKTITFRKPKSDAEIAMYYSMGIDPHAPTSTDATAVMITRKRGDKLVAEYISKPKEGVAFPELLNELLQYYPADNIVKERTDEDVMMELKAIQMFRPNVLKEFIEKHYGK